MQRRVHLLIAGTVQGVCFRHYTSQVARQLKLSGWVRNLADGRVEVMAEGEGPAIEKIIEWCHQGPSAAHVDHVEILEECYQGDLQKFAIRY